ncbi:baseplate J-like family protein, partial [Kluyvera sp. Nf5]
KDIFLQAINTVLDMSLISSLSIIVIVNGTITDPDEHTNIISGDPYSYWYISDDGVAVSGA